MVKKTKASIPLPKEKTTLQPNNVDIQPKHQKKKEIPSFTSLLSRIQSHQLFIVILILGALFALKPIYDAAETAWLEPEILPPPGQIADPFSLRFKLYNPSTIKITEAQIICRQKIVTYEDGNSELADNEFSDGTIITIEPKKTALYMCPYNRFFVIQGSIARASITIRTKFKTLGYNRSTESELFNWDSRSHQWEKGNIVN
jgi:hypothetical protein